MHGLVLPTPEMTVDAYIEECCRLFAARTAFVEGANAITFDDVWRRSEAIARYLRDAHGITNGTRVALILPNILEFPLCTTALMRLGAVQVNVNPNYTARELTHQLNDAETKIAIATSGSLPVLMSAEIPSLEAIVLTDAPAQAQFAIYPPKIPLAFLKDALASEYPPLPSRSHGSHDIAFLQYTGGTTGASKGAMLTHANIVSNIRQFLGVSGRHFARRTPNVLTAIPLYHVFGLAVNMLSVLAAGGRNVLITNPRDLDEFMNQWSIHEINFFTGVNTLFKSLCADPRFRAIDLSPELLAMGGGAPIQDVVSERWKELTGSHIRQGYGLSETSPVVTCTSFEENEFISSIGRPLQDTEISLRDDDGREVNDGASGELCVRGPQVMKGYWRNPEATAAVTTPDGFFKTGDIARRDHTGQYYIVDRKKDMILVSGFNVYPNEIEAIVSEIPGVAECASIGVPDASSGEVVAVFVVRNQPELDAVTIQAYTRRHLAAYKVPRHVIFLDDMPKSSVGKILRRQLRDRFQSSLGQVPTGGRRVEGTPNNAEGEQSPNA